MGAVSTAGDRASQAPIRISPPRVGVPQDAEHPPPLGDDLLARTRGKAGGRARGGDARGVRCSAAPGAPSGGAGVLESAPGAVRRAGANRAGASSGRPGRDPAPSSRSLPPGRGTHKNGPLPRPVPRRRAPKEASGCGGGAHGPRLLALARARRIGETPARIKGASARARPGPPPAGRQVRKRLGQPPESPSLIRDPADGGAKTRPRAVARGEESVGPPRCPRGGPGEDVRGLAKRRTAIARVWRRLQGCRRLCSRCEQRDVLVLGCIGFALLLNALQ